MTVPSEQIVSVNGNRSVPPETLDDPSLLEV